MIEHLASVVLAATLHTAQPTNRATVATHATAQPFWVRVGIKYRDTRYERFRVCVEYRESENLPRVVSHDGHQAQGLYQIEPRWFDTWLRVRLRLYSTKYAHTPIHLMPRKLQDVAFWRILDHGKNWRAWAGGRYDCTRYLP
jgi:hypothetical protein